MASETPLTAEAVSKQNPTLDPTSTLLCGSGIDASAAGTLAIGAVNASTISIGRTGQTVNVVGNFSVTGTSSSSTVVEMVDRVIHLGVTTGNAAVPTLPVGISVDRGASAGVDRDMSSLIWDEATSRWKFALITQGDDATLGAYQTVQALRFDAPTLGRTDAGALALGGSATSIVASAPITFDAAQVGTIQTRTLTLGHADLTALATSQVLNIGAVLPENAMVLGLNIALTTPFTGGGSSAVLVDIGTSGDDDAIGSNGDLFAAAVDGVVSALSSGLAPNKVFVSAGAQLIATVTADVNVDLLTAGAATITISFVRLS